MWRRRRRRKESRVFFSLACFGTHTTVEREGEGGFECDEFRRDVEANRTDQSSERDDGASHKTASFQNGPNGSMYWPKWIPVRWTWPIANANVRSPCQIYFSKFWKYELKIKKIRDSWDYLDFREFILKINYSFKQFEVFWIIILNCFQK